MKQYVNFLISIIAAIFNAEHNIPVLSELILEYDGILSTVCEL